MYVRGEREREKIEKDEEYLKQDRDAEISEWLGEINDFLSCRVDGHGPYCQVRFLQC